MAANQKVYVEITGTAQRLVNEVTKAQKSISFLELSARRLQNTLMGIGAYQVISSIGNVVNTLAEFDRTMTAVGVITGSTKEDFDKLEKSALTLGSTTQYTAKQVAELQLEFGRLGFSTKEILDATQATVNLATATGEGLARSAEIAGSTLRAFQLDSKEMTRVTDVMAASLNSSALTLDTFADGIKYVSPVAKATGVTLEETAAMMSVLADAGIKGSQAGTSLRRIFTMLTNDGKPLQERLDGLAKKGITLADANDEVGLYAQTALLQLTAMLPRVKELTAEFENAKGSTEAMARAMENNLATSITKVGTAWDALILSFRESKGFLMSFFDGIAENLTLMSGGQGAEILRFNSLLNGLQASLNVGNGVRKAQLENLLTLAKELNREINVIRDSSGKITGIYETVRGGNVGPAPFNQQLLGVKQILDVQRQNEQVEQQRLDALKKQTEEYKKQFEKALEFSESFARSNFDDILAGFTNSTITAQNGLGINIPSFGTGEAGDMSQSALDSWFSTLEENLPLLEEYDAGISSLTDELINNYNKTMAMRDMWIQFGETVANQLDNVIAKNKSFGQSMAELAGRVIDSNREIIISNLKAGLSGIFARFPIGAPIIAGLALSAISGLLKKVGGTSDQNVRVSPISGSYGMSPYGGYASSVTVYQRGTEMVGTLTETNRLNGRTRG